MLQHSLIVRDRRGSPHRSRIVPAALLGSGTILMKFCVTGSSRVAGIMPPGNGRPWSTDLSGASPPPAPEKSPVPPRLVGTSTPFTNRSRRCRKPWYDAKKKVLFLRTGPPKVPPNWFHCRGVSRGVEEVVRVDRIVPQKLEQRAVVSCWCPSA